VNIPGSLFIVWGLCITAEKWFASGESNVFRLSRDDVNGLSEIMMTAGRSLSGKDF
jgi:hypothetical protein